VVAGYAKEQAAPATARVATQAATVVAVAVLPLSCSMDLSSRLPVVAVAVVVPTWEEQLAEAAARAVTALARPIASAHQAQAARAARVA
jgi:hypothetical protein